MSDTIARLNAASRLAPGAPGAPGAPVTSAKLTPLSAFGTNPGALTAYSHVPEGVIDMPLVVVLHGCSQNAAGYDRGSGWSDLADRFGFALLFAEQTRGNNPNGCFNWFTFEDTRRGDGEAASIRQMIAAMVDRHPIDTSRIFVTGLSAGGAMTSVMLATYPDVFAGGAIIAGLPYGAAASVPQAFDRMRGTGHPDAAAYGRAVRDAAAHEGRWPDISVWHGTGDRTVDVVNADHIVGQWRAVHDLPATPVRDEMIDGARHRVWLAADGARIEEYRIAGMGHGTPLRRDGDTACGAPMPYMLDAGISSTWHIAKGWGLLGKERAATAQVQEVEITPARRPDPVPQSASAADPMNIQATIEAALRSAGLMR